MENLPKKNFRQLKHSRILIQTIRIKLQQRLLLQARPMKLQLLLPERLKFKDKKLRDKRKKLLQYKLQQLLPLKKKQGF